MDPLALRIQEETMPPKGWRKNTAQDAPPELKETQTVQAPAPVEVEKPVSKGTVYPPEIEKSREVLKHPLAPGQAFFEAPDGFVVVGEESKDRAFYRAGNNGKGLWINRMRG